MREVRFVLHIEELEVIHKLGNALLDVGYNASNSVIITVSTDYSSIAGQILRHHLSYEREICEGFGIDVPYPDEVWNKKYNDEMYEMFKLHATSYRSKSLIFVEAG